MGLGFIVGIIVLVLSVIVHEVCHGFVAYLLGDPTAKNAGRLTLNPFPHIDPWGTLAIPTLLILAHSPVIFGSAKPVPIDPRYFGDPKKDMALVGLAGPTANFTLAGLAAFLYHLTPSIPSDTYLYLRAISSTAVHLNLALAVFNLIPVPPLDGSRLLAGILPPELAIFLYRLEPYGIFILFLLLLPNGPLPVGPLVFSVVQSISSFLGIPFS